MARCYDCDLEVYGDDVCRRTVKVGSTRSSFLGLFAGHLLPGLWGTAHYAEVRLCPVCADRRDTEVASGRLANLLWAVVLFGAILAALMIFWATFLRPTPWAFR